MFRTAMILGVGLACGLAAVPRTAAAQDGGKGQIILNDGKKLEGEIKRLADGGYELTSKGITRRFKRGEVKSVEFEKATAEAAPAGKGGTSPGKSTEAEEGGPDAAAAAEAITDDIIDEILGDDAIEAGADVALATADLSPLPLNKASLDEMLRVAVTGKGTTPQVYETPHFVLVYTSTKDLARELASRLESVYKWCHTFMKMTGIPPQRPEFKLEIYFFATYEEFKAYGAAVTGGIPDGVAGFYQRDINRSAFFDMREVPQIAEMRKQLAQPGVHWRQRQFITNRMNAWSDYYNVTVIQHEAAHHIHFNCGIFNRKGDYPRWLTEGLAQMFELPPGKLGASLGVTNHYRLGEFRKKYRRNRDAVPPSRQFICDDGMWGMDKYPEGWAMTNYLWAKKREAFSAYMRRLAQRPDGERFNPTQRQQEFEDLFGAVDDKFHKNFVDFTLNIPYRPSAVDY